MTIMLGSARIDERGKITSGTVGDQKQTGTPDKKGEVSQQVFYKHKKGWYILRPKSAAVANKMAELMIKACNNKHLGYDQSNRLGVITYGIDTKKNTECDCSSLVRACIKEASGKDPGNFRTATQVQYLERSGLFEKAVKYVSQEKTPVYDGDVVVTCTSGHTCIVTSGNPRKSAGKKTNEAIAKEVIAGKWGNGSERKKKLKAAGYNYSEVQSIVNKLLK